MAIIAILAIPINNNSLKSIIMDSNDFAKPKSSYRKLYVFQKAEAIYDMTYYFLQGHIAKSDRTYDQMLQAA